MLIAPTFSKNIIVSSELHINQWIKMLNSAYGGFHSLKTVEGTHEGPFYDERQLAAYVNHYPGWTLIVPTNKTNDPHPVISSTYTLSEFEQVLVDNIYMHKYDISNLYLDYKFYRVEVDAPDYDLIVYTPFEILENVTYPTLHSFDPPPLNYVEWNNVSETIQTLYDSTGINSKPFVMPNKFTVGNGNSFYYFGSARHIESSFLYSMLISLPEHNNVDESLPICQHYWVDCLNCPDEPDCWCYHDTPNNEPCREEGNLDRYGTMSIVLELEETTNNWVDLMSWHNVVLRHQYDAGVDTIELWDVGLLKPGDIINDYTVTEVRSDERKIKISPPTRRVYQANSEWRTSLVDTTYKVNSFEPGFRQEYIQDVIQLPSMPLDKIYNLRLRGYGQSHASPDNHGDVEIGYLGEIGVESVDPQWYAMRLWDCNDDIIGEEKRKLSDIILNIEFLKQIDVINNGSRKVRELFHTGSVFRKKYNILHYYLQDIGDNDPVLKYYDSREDKWAEEKLNGEEGIWHSIDLSSISKLHTDDFYELHNVSFAIEGRV